MAGRADDAAAAPAAQEEVAVPLERAEPRHPRRYDGKRFAIALGAFLVLGTALTTYYALRAERAAQQAADVADGPAAPGP